MSQELFPGGITIIVALHTHISAEEWTLGQLVAAVLRHILIPSLSVNRSAEVLCRNDVTVTHRISHTSTAVTAQPSLRAQSCRSW
jgi:hypothetical protein